ncbi:hypothetical protein Ae168Ps1_5301c [Pseudonocardia sp. Ae168_Ps1]|uniref:hypothetical protein n=1 Tax=unclassified Pseudonocardia TaxID=2619320 RepID=UPI00094B64AA|nr:MULTISPECIES: hypothetical protein [unclassified Pseudonocardia]OLL76881.1 hypothetical protein Ae150APs1_5259c [Pseudonocardia sp. Ae150A_Ps1]OLL82895.1 hypothetical protein Ae168Ps1_5301c [Pseudonocardia sp. Ae168_Ps1]OLL82993.1 hypothetical protein Ae263Ps1_0048 [Pseudonocardia sp. Ae263_Ps1]OLL90969.1 hypothetical protein Ae356Ps1_0866c [Pseudonocardia sp. Ae356_Ps1]
MIPPTSRTRSGTDAALRTIVDAATRTLRAETLEALSTRRAAAALARTYERLGQEQRAGHLFELWHGHTFNVDAIRQGASVRATVTAACGEPTAPADLRIVDQGRVLDEVQAKLYGRAAAATRALAQSRYRGMQRLVAGDKREHVERLLDKALLRDSDGLYQDDYADTRAHLTDTVRHGDVSSTPLDTDDVHRAAGNVGRWGNHLAARAAGREVVGAAASGAVIGGGFAGLAAAARETARVRAGETTAAAAACTAAGAAARSAARSGALAGLGAGARIALTHAKVPASVTGSGLPGAVASAAFGVADAAISLARGDVSREEFAEISCDVTFQAGMAWAGGAVGQTVLPVPVVGALVGGFVGQVSATLIVQGIQLAIAAVHSGDPGDDGLALLETEAGAAAEAAALLGAAGAALGAESGAYAETTVVPEVDHALWSSVDADPESGLTELVELAEGSDGTPLFVSLDEFDAWMSDPLTTLSLTTSWT